MQNRKNVISKNKVQRKRRYDKITYFIHKRVFDFVLLKLMTCAVPCLVLIYGAQMEISVEMTKLSTKTQFHVALFIALFFETFL